MRVYTYLCMQARPVSTNPGCMEEGCEYGLTRGTCFVARRLEVVAVAGLLWIYSAVCFFRVSWDFVFFCCSFSFLRTHTACCKHEATSWLIYLSTSTGVRTGYHYLICLYVCLCVCQCGRFFFRLTHTACCKYKDV